MSEQAGRYQRSAAGMVGAIADGDGFGGVRRGDRHHDDGGRQQAAQRGKAAAQDLVHRSTRFATAQGSPARGVGKEPPGSLHRIN